MGAHDLHHLLKAYKRSAVQAFMAAEELGPENRWVCPKCKEGVQARMQLHLWTLPEVLVIHLKRFIHSGMRHCSKIDDDIAIPLEVSFTIRTASAAEIL
jgi:ubiquitin C-terminal hydrolase